MRPTYLPYSISLYITFDCHLKCPHCFLVQKGQINKFRLSYETISSVIEDAYKHGVFTIIIAGGDPVLHPDFFKIIDLIRSKKMIPLVACTGTNLTDELIHQIVTAGIPTLQLSLDGAIPETHDRIRRPGNFEEVCNAANRITAAGLNLNIALCIHKSNFNEINDIFKLCLDLNAYKIKLTFYLEFVPTKDCTPLNSEEISLALKYAFDFNTKHAMNDWIICPGYDLKSAKISSTARRSPDIVVSADGSASIDEAQPAIGNVNNESLPSIYTRHINKIIASFYHNLITKLSNEYSVSTIESTNSDLSASALIYKYGDHFHILLDKQLCETMRFFTILHEIGHIATKTINLAPRAHNEKNNEHLANKWALMQLKEHIHPDAFYQYENALLESEQALFHQIRDHLPRDLINFF